MNKMTTQFIKHVRRQVEQWKSHPRIKEWDAYNFMVIFDEQQRKIKELKNLLKHHGVWYD